VIQWLSFSTILVTLVLLLRLRNLYRREKRLSREDSKTGALSERGFIEALKDESKRSRRHLRPLTVVYVDLDNFSAVNGRFGYDTGDAVLRVATRTMRGKLREVDVVSRRQGDEFVLLLPETRAEGVPLVLSKLQRALREAMTANHWPVTSSMGAITFLQPLDPVEAMITASSNLMFSAAKHAGKGRFKHLAFEARMESDNLVHCSKCRSSFIATDHASCPSCGNEALQDAEPEKDAVNWKIPRIALARTLASDRSGRHLTMKK
jgi:diguanylate cyclase (GGDEF)-like protein